MLAAAKHVVTEADWRLKTLMKGKRFFTTPELMRLYKAQILSFLESSTPALYHAAASILAWIDRVQTRFLRDIGPSDIDALRNFRLAPLGSRRDMAMLAVLHKINLGMVPPQLQALFPKLGRVEEPLARHRLRYGRPLHTKQLATHANFASSNVLQRSLFGLVHCYNGLPQRLVDASSVKVFQRNARPFATR